MLPATLAHDVKKQLLHYLGATFQMRLPENEQALQRFFNDPAHGLFKGPWVQVKRPFREAKNNGAQFFDLDIPFMPFRHQRDSWKNLTSKDNKPRHTLVTTGTGSGKTECFLYPLLDHCLRQRQAGKRDGIKAIVLYPMNALASDQAGRFAEEVLKSKQLSDFIDGEPKARVRVGLYTGRMSLKPDRKTSDKLGLKSSTGTAPGDGTYREMTVIKAEGDDGKTSYSSITNREYMQDDPPDILLTNYKMLDYLLLRPKDSAIWRHNLADPSLLQYLVLDELHTYDGAQGSDVACLLRRLKERLNLPDGQLCVAGTSATIAGGDDERNMDPLDRLCEFASTLFEEDLRPDCVIQEDRLSVDEIIGSKEARDSFQDEMEEYPITSLLEPRPKEDSTAYAHRVASLFAAPVYPVAIDHPLLTNASALTGYKDVLATLDDKTLWGLALAEWLRVHPLFEALLRITEEAAIGWDALVRLLSKQDFVFREVGSLAGRNAVLMAFMALVAQARELRSKKAFPLVPTQVQLWLRELRRLGAMVSEDIVFSWLDSPVPDKKQLPVVHCTECGEVAWVALDDPDQESMIRQHCEGYALRDDTKAIYQDWGFDGRAPSTHVVILSPWRESDDPVQENKQQELAVVRHYLAPTSLVVRQGEGDCPLTGEKTFPVKVVKEIRPREKGGPVGVRRCPHCGEEDTLMFMGSRAATIASVAIDEVFGSVLNNDPKLLAFTDSVQDASHRAGFFSSRTYHFTLRTALQHVIDDAGEQGLPLSEVGEAMLHYWSQKEVGRPGSEKKVLATLLPPDLREYPAYLEFRDNPAKSIPSPQLREDFIRRLSWQATSEFSLMLNHGRTMELHASATLGWEPSIIEATVDLLQEQLPKLSPVYERLGSHELTRWVFGILHRQRERGGLYHPYLDQFAIQNGLWGKFSWGGQQKRSRETYPPKGRYLPKLLVNVPTKHNDNFLSPPRQGHLMPWQLTWARRVLELPTVDDASLVDALAAFLKCAEQSGLLHCVHVDGEKSFYALNDKAARFYGESHKLVCDVSGHVLFRPAHEAKYWVGAPSQTYQARYGYYQPSELSDRERYYQQRYRKGALRRVFAHEHTGMLNTQEREALELNFNSGGKADDPNVLTATSTLEMGIDIGDLSTTMLCSIPPSTASYLQRIGRAGRKTGTALVLSVINQRPHDLFFYSRPEELLAGSVEPPGCWLDASAVLVRQYLAFCFDQAVREEVLTDLPATGKQLIDEVIILQTGHIPRLLDWILKEEQFLQRRFLARFKNGEIQTDTEERFVKESMHEVLKERVEQAAAEFQLQRTSLQNAQRRLKEGKSALDPVNDLDDLKEVEREEKILKARQRKLGEISALEVLTEHGLLPNYAFPDRGVRFSGSVYNRHEAADNAQPIERPSIELVRSASSAIRELAPGNHFYTHSRRFDIQQLDIGSANQPLVESWSVCGQCGHMRMEDELKKPDTVPACPQCGYDGPFGQTDRGQTKDFLPLQRSMAVSYMEHYDSLSADSGEERESEFYSLVSSFDHTIEKAPNGAVTDDELPFGIEYRSSVIMREVNAGYMELQPDFDFGFEKKVPSGGFEICQDCGVVKPPSGAAKQELKSFKHRRSCSGESRTKKLKSKGKSGDGYEWKRLFLHRELKSEAIRLLLPDVESEDLATLEAAIYLGLRVRFQGNPGHLLVKPQVVPDHSADVTRYYLVLMDAVPGGTGFLKSLYQEQNKESGLPAEGIVDVLQLALNALETCDCRRIEPEHDTDGCYRCIRTYHLQYKSELISSTRGIKLLKQLLEACERRVLKKSLDEVKVTNLFGSVLEKRFVKQLQSWVESRDSSASWRSMLISGTEGFEFTLGDGRLWTIELQPLLGPHNGVSLQCQPDFMLRCDHPEVKPVAVFTDGYEFHVCPEEEESRLADDMQKRRAILDSEQFQVWSITWQDLQDEKPADFDFLHSVAKRGISAIAAQRKQQGFETPDLSLIVSNPFEQLKAFVECPRQEGWKALAHQAANFGLMMMAGAGVGQSAEDANSLFELWKQGYSPPHLTKDDQGEWTWSSRVGLGEDLLVYTFAQESLVSDFTNLRVALRLGDSKSERVSSEEYSGRWRRFLASMNLFQFAQVFLPFVVSEVEAGSAPDIDLKVTQSVGDEWLEVIEDTVSGLVRLAKRMAGANKALPEVEYYNDDLDDDDLFAELAWPEAEVPLAILFNDQASFTKKWQDAGWHVVTDKDIKAKGEDWVMGLIPEQVV